MISPASTSTSEYLLLFRGTDWHRGLSPEETQNIMAQWYAWFDGLAQDGRLVSGQPLGNEGRVVSGSRGRNVSDGPFAETKEAVGGYFLVRVADIEEAIEIAQQCPALGHGLTVEVRPIIPRCAAGAPSAVSMKVETARAMA